MDGELNIYFSFHNFTLLIFVKFWISFLCNKLSVLLIVKVFTRKDVCVFDEHFPLNKFLSISPMGVAHINTKL